MSESYLVRYWGAMGRPAWGKESGGGGERQRLCRENRPESVQRLAVYAVPAEYAGLSIDALARCAADGLLERIFFDPRVTAKAEANAP